MPDELQNPSSGEGRQEVVGEPVATPAETAVPESVPADISTPIEAMAPAVEPVIQTPAESPIQTEASSPPPVQAVAQPAEALPPSPAPQVSQGSPAVEMDKKFYVNMGKWKEHLSLAMAKRAQRKQFKLDKVLALALSQGTITNKQVKKLLRCTKLTAWRYLKALEKQNKLRRTGSHNVPTYEVVK